MERTKGTGQEVAAMNNRTAPWPPGERSGKSRATSAPRRPNAPGAAQIALGAGRSGLTSAPAPYSLSPISPNVDSGLAFIGPCFICQLVGHRAADCPKRRCYSCGQADHMARTCSSRPVPRDIQCQGYGQEGTTLRKCPNCCPLVAALGNGIATT